MFSFGDLIRLLTGKPKKAASQAHHRTLKVLPSAIIELLDLDLALRRVITDINKGRTFFRHPHESELVDRDRDGWLATIRAELPTFVPGDLYLCNALKPKGAVRPGGILSIKDQTVYAALIGALSERIRAALDWGGERVDFSYPISLNPKSPEWFDNQFPLWRQFAEESLSRIESDTQHVVLADISAYYEAIDIPLLLSDLRAIGAEPALLDLLSKCLNRWSQAAIPGRSLPQGFSPSDILARFYLNRVDRALRDRGVNHLRYVDDIRIFSRSEAEAKKQFVELIVLLRKRGLSVHAGKSGIVTAEGAKAQIEGLLPALQVILKDFVDSIAELFEITDPYFNLARAEEILKANPNAAPIGLIREAYRKFFMQGEKVFDKSLFHFLLRRLGHATDPFALDHALSYLRTQPQETRDVLEYVEDIGLVTKADPVIIAYLESRDAVYPHQFYEVVAWRTRQNTQPPDSFLAIARSVLYDRSVAAYLRATCREFLARFGTEPDLERMQDELQGVADDLERAEILCCLRRMETSRRNAVLGRYSGAGLYTDRAVSLIRAGWAP